MFVVVAGIVAGLVASMPLVSARPERATLASGLAGLIFSFLFLSAAILVSRRLAAEAFVAFSVISVLTFVGIAAAATIRGAHRLA